SDGVITPQTSVEICAISMFNVYILVTFGMDILYSLWILLLCYFEVRNALWHLQSNRLESLCIPKGKMLQQACDDKNED
ncbi:hypothetical protein ACJX0J_027413, partial [Zea mays]